MKKLFLAGVALTALVAAPAMAADIARPVYKAPPPVVAVYSWTGCYVGAHVGGLWARKDWSRGAGDTFFATTPAGASFGSHDADSWLGGFQAGCDYQFAGGFVVGIQGDYAWTDAEGSNVNVAVPIATITPGSGRCRRSPAASVMPGVVSSAT